MKKTYQEQIKEAEGTRQAKSARMDELMEPKDGVIGLDEAAKEEYDALDADVKTIDEHLVRLRAADKRQAEQAKAIVVTDEKTAGEARNPHRPMVTVSRELPKGILFARYAMCMGASRGMAGEAMRLAKAHYPDDPGVYSLVEKTAVAGGSTSGSHYLDDMIPYSVMADFIEFLRPGSIIGKFGGPNPGGGGNYPSLNRVGFNQRVSGMSTGYTAGWKGEGLPALPSAAVTFNTSLTWNCMSALAVLTKEAIRFSNPECRSARPRRSRARRQREAGSRLRGSGQGGQRHDVAGLHHVQRRGDHALGHHGGVCPHGPGQLDQAVRDEQPGPVRRGADHVVADGVAAVDDGQHARERGLPGRQHEGRHIARIPGHRVRASERGRFAVDPDDHRGQGL
jgi:hypothetical protein